MLQPNKVKWSFYATIWQKTHSKCYISKMYQWKILSLTIVSSTYQNFRLVIHLSCIKVLSCQFGRYRNKQQPFGETPAGHIIKKKIDAIFKYIVNVLGIADDILALGYDNYGIDHDNKLWRVQIYRKENQKFNKDKCTRRCKLVQFFGNIISGQGIRPDLRNLKALTDMPPLKSKKDCRHSFVY